MRLALAVTLFDLETAMGEKLAPEYGASDHYLGDSGKSYFEFQQKDWIVTGPITARRFAEYVSTTDSVLDFGCGTGKLLNYLNCAGKIGVEINPIARQHATQLGIQCFADLADVPDGTVDVVLSNHALEHVLSPISALQLMRNKLKPDGLAVIALPINNWRKEKTYQPGDINNHLYTWTPQLFGNALREAGFDVIRVELREPQWPPGFFSKLYHYLPFCMFRALCFSYSVISGRGWEVLAVAKAPSAVPNDIKCR